MGRWSDYSGLVDKAEKEDARSKSSLFVKLKDHGDSVIGAFVGEPFDYEAVWTGSRHEAYDPSVHTEKPKLRFMVNFFDVEKNDLRVYEFGITVMKQLIQADKKYGLDKSLFEVSRNGVKGDQKTTYSVLFEKAIDERLARTIASYRLHDLEALAPKGPSRRGIADGPVAEGKEEGFNTGSIKAPAPSESPLAGFFVRKKA